MPPVFAHSGPPSRGRKYATRRHSLVGWWEGRGRGVGARAADIGRLWYGGGDEFRCLSE